MALVDDTLLHANENLANDCAPKSPRPNFAYDLRKCKRPLFAWSCVLDDKRNLCIVTLLDYLDHAIFPCGDFRSIQEQSNSQFILLHGYSSGDFILAFDLGSHSVEIARLMHPSQVK